MKFATKLSLLFSGLFLLLCFVITHMVTISSRDILERTIQMQMERRTQEKMDRIDKFFFERDLDTKMLATDAALRSKKVSPEIISARLRELRKNSGSYISLSFFDMNRKRIVDTLGTDIGKVHDLTEYWPEIESGKESVFDMYYSESLGFAAFHFAKVIKNDTGAASGVLVARVSTEWLDEIASQTALPDIKVDIVNRSGLVVYSSYNPQSVLKERSIYWEKIKDAATREIKHETYRLQDPGKEEEIVVVGMGKGYKDFTGNGWTLIAHVPSRVVFAPAIELRNRLLMIMSVIGGFSLLAILLFARTVSRPLMQLSDAAEQIGKGNLEVKVDVASRDEVAALAAKLNEMAANIFASKRALEKAKVEAEDATSMKDKLITLLSHDLKTPLIGMMGMMQLLRDQPDIGPESRRAVELALHNNKRMLLMIDQLLDVNRIRSGKLRLKLRYCDGADVIRDAVANVESMANQKGVLVQNTVAQKTLVWADPVFLKEVFCNLLSNAVKFSERGKAVNIMRLPGENIIFAVEDSGIGIPPDKLKVIFSFHEKTTSFGTMGETGTGFGLPLSAEVMGALNGKLEVRPRPEGGTAFYVILPRLVPKLLILEDHSGSCSKLKMQLEEQGFTVTASSHALKILEILKGERIDLLMVELSVSKETGAELLRLVRCDADLKEMPILAMEDGAHFDSVKYGAHDIMTVDRADESMVIERIYAALMAKGSEPKG